MLSEFGIFKLTDKSFTIKLDDRLLEIDWDSISQIDVFKVDQITIDCIVMELTYNDRILRITEEEPGWNEFTDGLEKIFPAIPKDWWQNVAHPAFATNFATIYKKALITN